MKITLRVKFKDCKLSGESFLFFGKKSLPGTDSVHQASQDFPWIYAVILAFLQRKSTESAAVQKLSRQRGTVGRDNLLVPIKRLLLVAIQAT